MKFGQAGVLADAAIRHEMAEALSRNMSPASEINNNQAQYAK